MKKKSTKDLMIAILLNFTIVYSALYLRIYLWLGYLKSQLINKILNYFIFICLIITVVMVTLIDNDAARDSLMNFVILPNFALICILLIILYTSVNISIKCYENKDLIL
ncbi:hypothetical protein [Clostridium estertheticum]|nr:hypothetical protein [Clostridium estertheticum]MCB2347374.1 hypothetical protein [Clostridium estertheticum]